MDVRESGCEREQLGNEVIKTVPGFPGLLVIAAGGHTPGSTIYVVRVDGENWASAGDITNDMQSLHDNVGKAWLYSNLLIPENTAWLDQLRRWLESIDQTEDFTVLVAHDIGAFERSTLRPWGS